MDFFLKYLQPANKFFQNQPWAQGIITLVISVVLAWIITALLIWVIRRLANRTKTTIDDRIIEIIKAPLFYSLLISGFSASIVLMPLTEHIEALISNGFKTIGVLIWVTAAIRIADLMLHRLAFNGKKRQLIRPQTLPLFDNLSKMFIIVLGIYLIFQSWGVDMTAWLASAGIIGIAVGFAAKDTLANLFSGVFIMADSPYKIGDYVVLDNTERGKVTHIGIRSTRLLTRDDVEVTIPNSIMGNSKVINQSGGPYTKFRLRLPIGVAYGSDIDQVEEILMAVAEAEPLVVDDPAPRVRFRMFGHSSLDYELLCWVADPEQKGLTTHQLNREIYKGFSEHGVEIPYTKQDLYIKELPPS